MPPLVATVTTPAESASVWSWLLLAPACLAGFFVSGHMIFLRVPSPLPWATAFAGSFLALFGLVLGYDACGVPITFPSLAGGLAFLSLIGWLAAGRSRSPQDLSFYVPIKSVRLTDLLWSLPLFAVLASVLVRTVVDPLAGWDNEFRWNYIALLILEQGSLSHYPPVLSADFRFYSWCDGIPPGVPILNLWIYLAHGSTAGVLIAARVAVELALIAALTLTLGHKANGRAGALLAGGVLAGSSLFGWSIGLAQETGTTCVFVLLLANLLADHRARPSRATALWIGLSAGALALCRDYNLLYLPVALGLLIAARAPRAHLFAALAGTLVAAPWYLRNALLTGNPLYAHDLGGLLATNPFHADLMDRIRFFHSPTAQPAMWTGSAKLLAVGLGAAVLFSLPGWVRGLRRAPELIVLAIIVVGLWLVSISSTAGGWVYSARTLAPVAPLLAALAAHGALARFQTSIVWLTITLLLGTDTARRSWIYMHATFAPPFHYDWKLIQPGNPPGQIEQPLDILAAMAGDESIVVDAPGLLVQVRGRKASAISIFSPEVNALTRHTGPIEDTVAELRARGIRFVIFTQTTRFGTMLASTHPALGRLWKQPPAVDLVDAVRIYDLAVMNGETPKFTLNP